MIIVISILFCTIKIYGQLRFFQVYICAGLVVSYIEHDMNLHMTEQ